MSIDFEANITSGICPLEVIFKIIADDNLFNKCDDGIKYLLFDFGDGEFSTDLKFNHTHIYSSLSSFTVILYLSETYISFNKNEYNLIEVYTNPLSIVKLNYITIGEIFPDFNSNYTTLFTNKLVIFNIDMDDDIFSQVKYLLFDFGDGTYSETLSKIHYKAYLNSGLFTVKLYVSKIPIYFIVENNTINIINMVCIFYKEKISFIEIIKIDYLDFTIFPLFCISPMFTTLSIDISNDNYNDVQYMYIDFGDTTSSNLKQLSYSKIYNLDVCECCKSYDVSIYIGVVPIVDLSYTESVTKRRYIKIISKDFTFDFSADKTQGFSPLKINFEILINYSTYHNCFKNILIDFGDGGYEYTQDKLNFEYEYKTAGIFTVSVYMSYEPIVFTSINNSITVQNIDCLLYIKKNNYINIQNLKDSVIIDITPMAGLHCLEITINLNILSSVLNLIKYILIDFDDGTYIYSQQILKTYSNIYKIPMNYIVKIYISDEEIDFTIDDFADYPFNLTCLNANSIEMCRKVITFNECKNYRVGSYLFEISVRHALFTYVADLCPCSGWTPLPVNFTIIIDDDIFNLVNYLLFDFGDGTYSETLSKTHYKLYSIVGIYSPILYLSTNKIIFTIDVNNKIIIDSDCISKYTRIDYVAVMKPGFTITPIYQTGTKGYTATFTVDKDSIPIDQRHPNRCADEPLKGYIWSNYIWNALFDFGDGKISTDFIDVYQHTYLSIGIFTAILYLSVVEIDYDINGNIITVNNISDTWLYSVTVEIIDIQFTITATPNIGFTDLNSVIQIIISQTIFDTYIKYIIWDFGDTQNSNKLVLSLTNSFSTLESIKVYTITAYVSSYDIQFTPGKTSSTVLSSGGVITDIPLKILNPEYVYSASTTITLIYPNVDFIATPLIGYSPLPVKFDMIVNPTSDFQYIKEYGFNFGDGNTSNISSNPTLSFTAFNTYLKSGKYDITLFFSDFMNSLFISNGIIAPISPLLNEAMQILKSKYIEVLTNYRLSLYITPNNSGTITCSTPVISCSNNIDNKCEYLILENTNLQLVAIPSTDYKFVKWDGDISTGSFNLTIDTLVWAEFKLLSKLLSIMITGAGHGDITDNNLIDCGSKCSAEFDIYTLVELVAIADSNSIFNYWELEGIKSYDPFNFSVTMNSDKIVYVDFILGLHVTIIIEPAEVGKVVSLDGIINCLTTCNYCVKPNTNFSLTATSNTDEYVFSTWSSNIPNSLSSIINLIVVDDITVIAFFVSQYILTINIINLGNVKDLVNGIDCNSSCTKSLKVGTNIVLTETPAIGYNFVSWGSTDIYDYINELNQFIINISENKTITVTFAIQTFILTININIPNAGNIIDIANDINTSASSTVYTLDYNTSVTLTETPMPGYFFSHWEDNSTTIQHSEIIMDSIKSVTAIYISVCEGIFSSGGMGTTINNYILPLTVTKILITVQMWGVPDRLIVSGGGTLDTGVVSNAGASPYIVNITNPNITITVIGTISGTAWEYSIECIY